jgi:hypothetical protein
MAVRLTPPDKPKRALARLGRQPRKCPLAAGLVLLSRSRGHVAAEPTEIPSEQEQDDHRCHDVPDAPVLKVHEALRAPPHVCASHTRAHNQRRCRVFWKFRLPVHGTADKQGRAFPPPDGRPVSGSGEGARPHRYSAAHLAGRSTETTLTHAEATERARRRSGRWAGYWARSGRLKRPPRKGRPKDRRSSGGVLRTAVPPCLFRDLTFSRPLAALGCRLAQTGTVPD